MMTRAGDQAAASDGSLGELAAKITEQEELLKEQQIKIETERNYMEE